MHSPSIKSASESYCLQMNARATQKQVHDKLICFNLIQLLIPACRPNIQQRNIHLMYFYSKVMYQIEINLFQCAYIVFIYGYSVAENAEERRKKLNHVCFLCCAALTLVFNENTCIVISTAVSTTQHRLFSQCIHISKHAKKKELNKKKITGF